MGYSNWIISQLFQDYQMFTKQDFLRRSAANLWLQVALEVIFVFDILKKNVSFVSFPRNEAGDLVLMGLYLLPGLPWCLLAHQWVWNIETSHIALCNTSVWFLRNSSSIFHLHDANNQTVLFTSLSDDSSTTTNESRHDGRWGLGQRSHLLVHEWISHRILLG